MQKEELKIFKNQYVKIELLPNYFLLYGTIVDLYDDCLYFSTRNKTSLIRFSQIASITPTNNKFSIDNNRRR